VSERESLGGQESSTTFTPDIRSWLWVDSGDRRFPCVAFCPFTCGTLREAKGHRRQCTGCPIMDCHYSLSMCQLMEGTLTDLQTHVRSQHDPDLKICLDQSAQNREPRNKYTHCSQLMFDKLQRTHNGKRTASL
jgi:hypothetical protein